MNVQIKSSVSHITAAGITIDILIDVDGEVSTLTITSRQQGARDWRYIVAMQGGRWRLDTDEFLKQEHKVGFDQDDVFDVSYVAHMVKHLGTDLNFNDLSRHQCDGRVTVLSMKEA